MYRKFFKRFLDILFSFLGLIILLPLFLVIYVLVLIFMGRPVIFKQERPGRGEKIFKLYKFRTMTDARNKKGELLPDEKRLTKFGKFLRSTSLDELPELVNILKGDMSFVGPRPLLVKYLPYYTKKEHHRHDVRPGLTGLAQVSGRNGLGWDERFEKDLEYIKNMSFVLDARIVLSTIRKVFKKEGIRMGDEMGMNDLDVERENSKDNIMEIDYQIYKSRSRELLVLINELVKNHAEANRVFRNMGVYLKDKSAKVFCYFEDGVFEGLIWGFLISRGRLHINYFVVAEKHRSKGVGLSLVNRMIGTALMLKCKYVELLVDKDNERAIKFYRRNGFLRDNTYDGNLDKDRMVLNVNNKGKRS